MCRTLVVCLLAAVCCGAQTLASPNIQASGNATISGIQPDQVQLTVGVVTPSQTSAQQAASQNATQTAAVIAALNRTVGASGTVQTVGYSLYPVYSGGNNPTITGYTATNTVQVTVTGTANLTLVGPIIDAANQAGANSINGPSYGLMNSAPYTEQALASAAKQALAFASAIAGGLGGKAGAVISAQQGSSVMPVTVGLAAAGGGTPIVTGTVSVSASVTVVTALVQ